MVSRHDFPQSPLRLGLDRPLPGQESEHEPGVMGGSGQTSGWDLVTDEAEPNTD